MAYSGGSKDLLRGGVNRARILDLLSREPGLDRTTLAVRMALTVAAVSRIVSELIEAGLVVEGAAIAKKGVRGPRRTQLKLNPSGGRLVGISILPFNASVQLSDLCGDEVVRTPLHFSNIADAERVLDECTAAACDLIAEDTSGVPVLGAVVAIAGYFDSGGHVMVDAPYLGCGKLQSRHHIIRGAVRRNCRLSERLHRARGSESRQRGSDRKQDSRGTR